MTLPAVPDTFAWMSVAWGDALVCRPLAAIAQHLFTTRQLELRQGGVESAGWQQIAAALGVDTSDLVQVRQVHGREVIVAAKAHNGSHYRRGEPAPEADAIVSDDPRTA